MVFLDFFSEPRLKDTDRSDKFEKRKRLTKHEEVTSLFWYIYFSASFEAQQESCRFEKSDFLVGWSWTPMFQRWQNPMIYWSNCCTCCFNKPPFEFKVRVDNSLRWLKSIWQFGFLNGSTFAVSWNLILPTCFYQNNTELSDGVIPYPPIAIAVEYVCAHYNDRFLCFIMKVGARVVQCFFLLISRV